MNTINTFLYGNEGDYSQSGIFDLVRNYFAGDKSAIFTEEEQPFGLSSKLRISFDDYWVLASVIEDESIKESIVSKCI